jgi:hypothetical protein
MELILAQLSDPQSLANVVLVMLALFAKDAVVAILRRAAVSVRTDKNKKNDHLADVADAVADTLDKTKIPPKLPNKLPVKKEQK